MDMKRNSYGGYKSKRRSCFCYEREKHKEHKKLINRHENTKKKAETGRNRNAQRTPRKR